MAGTMRELAGVRVWLADAAGPPLRRERDALDLIGDARAADARVVALPVARCGEAFFQLRTRILGDGVPKLVHYGVRCAIVGDVSPHAAASEAFRAFTREANRGRQVWFAATLAELGVRLAGEAALRR